MGEGEIVTYNISAQSNPIISFLYLGVGPQWLYCLLFRNVKGSSRMKNVSTSASQIWSNGTQKMVPSVAFLFVQAIAMTGLKLARMILLVFRAGLNLKAQQTPAQQIPPAKPLQRYDNGSVPTTFYVKFKVKFSLGKNIYYTSAIHSLFILLKDMVSKFHWSFVTLSLFGSSSRTSIHPSCHLSSAKMYTESL